ncbi:TrbC family F-type conjugative pilus assembly protein [Thiocapsa marina]|uniref:Type-F conjugative transfer system pilin assembly protein TrbC n=1 Tax=Thiocapsa marina 5811 TaxID=768671 RepID=F9UHS5_9GAMM|nr:TrbC family F-type conjugative pilus assembly protein [Thiocapsa marina]EGV16251.1 Type-F conjugative transfer system pilin assembly protein TrbC [Thiocapsa marina 5811]
MHCSERRFRALLVLALLSAPTASAQSSERADLRALRDQVGAIQEAVSGTALPDWLRNPPDASAGAGEALGAAERERMHRLATAQMPALPDAQATATATPTQTITLLVSRALGAAALRDIFASAARPEVRVVFRGVAEGEPLMDFMRGIHAELEGLDPMPAVALDPTPFREAGAAAVPLMILSGPDGEIARVAGLSDPAWLQAQVAAGRTGDLGVRGPVETISEPDMLEEIARRVAALDLAALREQALARYWRSAVFEHLPAAREPRTRVIDPIIEAKADIALPDGTLLVRSGERLNPLDRLAFGLRLVVFDPTEPGQIRTARRLGESAGALRPVYLATRLDREAGWEGFHALEDALDEPVYLLTADVRERFALERVPASVESADRVFLVREHPPEEPR